MRFVTSLLIAVITIATLAGPGDAKQYLNRRLLECDPLTYVVEPLEITGGTLHLGQFWSNEYGDCTGLTPGPPFIIEMGITIDNELNPDGTVLEWGNLIVSNQYGAAGPMEIVVTKGASLICYGPVEAHGGIGTPVVFTGNGHTLFEKHCPDTAEYERNFTYCNFRPGPYSSGDACEITGGHLTMGNCTFGPTDGSLGLSYSGYSSTYIYDVVIKDCFFDRTIMRNAVSPNQIRGARTLDIDGLRFNNCQVEYQSPVSTACLSISGGDIILKDLKNISGNNNTHDWITFGGLTDVFIKDCCTIQTSHNFPPLFFGNIIVDTNAVLSMENGSLIQVGTDFRLLLYPNSKLIMENSVITSCADKAYGIYMPGLSTDVPSELYFWDGIELEPGSSLEIKNNSVIRWSYVPIEGSGNVTIDHSTIEQHWGGVIDMRPTSPCSLNIIGSTIGPELGGAGEGIEFVMSIDPSDSAAGYIYIDSTKVTKCGGDGIYLGGGAGRSLDIDYNVRITNSTISGNGDNGLWGQMGPPADSIIIMNNTFVGNGGVGCYLNDAGCDSMSVRMENNIALGNGGTGLGANTGFVDIIGNSSLYNSGTGISYPQKPRRHGYVANNIMAYNDSRGFYCYAKYGGIVPTFAHNIVWSNNGADDDLSFRSDDFDVYTMADLHALGGVGLTNDEFSPELRPISKAPVRSYYYYEALNETGVYVGGTALLAGQFTGLAVLPTQRDTTYWSYVVRNTQDSVYIAGDVRSAINNGDTMTFYDYHLSQISPAIGFGDNDYVATEHDIDGDARIIDADSNGTALVDAGGDEFNPDSTLSMFLVGSPKNDTTLVPGENVFIAWYAPGIDSVNIDYTFDIPLGGESSAWLQLAQGYPTTLPIYSWEIPAIQSSRCRVRISDAADPSHFAYSGIFHVKQVRLTRFGPDSTYEFYEPSEHGWSFGNTVSEMWPPSTWSAIDYSNDYDPYTGRPFPVDDPAYPIGPGDEEYFPNWLLWVETFGVDQCYNTTPSGLMYIMRTMYRWDDYKRQWFGSCVGLSTSSLLSFGNLNLLQPRWSYLNLPDDSIHQLSLSDDIREFVNIHQTAAYGVAQYHYYYSGYSIPIDTTLKNIRLQLLNTDRNDATVIIGRQDNQAAHSMVPYAIDSDTDPSKIRVMVYDPSDPSNDNSFILVDTVTDEWDYAHPTYNNWGGAHNFYMYYPVKTVIDNPELIGLGRMYDEVQTDIIVDSLIDFMYTMTADLKLYNEAEDSVGFNDSGLFNSIGEGSPIIPFDVDSARPFGFLLPNQEYHGTIGNSQDSILKVGCYYDSLYVGYRRICLDSTEVDHIRISNGLKYFNLDATTKSLQFTVINTLPDRERALVALGYEIGINDTALIEPIADSGWYLFNHGTASQYDLLFREVTHGGEKVFSVEDVTIAAGQGHMILPDWTNLASDTCWLYLDNDSNKTIDDSTMLIGDIVLDVEEESDLVLPCEFELFQNYPNPFNPTTTIRYNLPQRSHVTIDVFNVLGQKVRTLVDREEAAGSYRVSWNGTNSSGRAVSTGVYLYRFRAGEHVETKKMLLLK